MIFNAVRRPRFRWRRRRRGRSTLRCCCPGPVERSPWGHGDLLRRRRPPSRDPLLRHIDVRVVSPSPEKPAACAA